MRGIQHLTLGFAVGITGAFLYGVPVTGMGFAASCCVASLYPDLDIPTSTAGKVVSPVSILINRVCGHRGFFHSPINLAVSVFLYYKILLLFHLNYPEVYALGFLCGFLIHLIQDTFTVNGIRWLWPLPWKIRIVGIHSDRNTACWIVTTLLFIFSLFFLKKFLF